MVAVRRRTPEKALLDTNNLIYDVDTLQLSFSDLALLFSSACTLFFSSLSSLIRAGPIFLSLLPL